MNPLTQPRWLLHAEGGLLLSAVTLAYGLIGGPWWLFAVLFFAPDLAALGYLVHVRVGATTYNAVHTTLLPLLLLGWGYYSVHPLLIQIALIWFGHIGLDRLLGFGLKYPTRFQDTHLQHV